MGTEVPSVEFGAIGAGNHSPTDGGGDAPWTGGEGLGDRAVRFAYWERVTLAAAMCLIAAAGCLGNGLVIASVALSRRLRTATNVYVVSLAATDLLTCLCLPWQALGAASASGWPLPEWICAAVGGLSITFVGCSVLTLACIAVNRLVLITGPSERYRRLYTARFLAATTVLAWALPAATVAVPPALGTGRLGYDEEYLRCGPLQSEDDRSWNPYDLIVSVVLYPVPTVTIVASYCWIFRYIRLHTRSLLGPAGGGAGGGGSEKEPSSSSYPKSPAAHSNGSQQQQSQSALKQQNSTRRRLSRRQVAITKNLFYVVCAFLLCLTPYSAAVLIPGAEHFAPYAGLVLLLNSCVNPAIYAAKHPHFGGIFRCLLTCRLADVPEPAGLLRCALSRTK